MTDLYSGTLGMLFDKNKLIYLLNEYTIQHDEELNYEFIEDRTKIVIITGKNKQEQDLPVFGHPLTYENNRGEVTVAIDVRQYMKANLKDMITVREKLEDKYNGMIQLYRMIFTKQILDGETSWLKHIKYDIVEAYADIITTIIGMTLYDTTVSNYTKILSKLHFLSIIKQDDDLELEDLVKQLPREDIQELLKGELKDVYKQLVTEYDNDNIHLPSFTIGALITNIINIIPTNRGKGLTPDILIQTLSRGFYSLDGKNLAIAMNEDLSTFLAIFVVVNTESINSKSSFRKIFNNNKRKIDSKKVCNTLIDVYKQDLLDI